mmetsp:Transcript_87079/g.269596  ORF Transcript_87079/g.269596 Transcript_87079/m.269596 type:complete len:325 (-) Transcript_87079:366-1340(-)
MSRSRQTPRDDRVGSCLNCSRAHAKSNTRHHSPPLQQDASNAHAANCSATPVDRRFLCDLPTLLGTLLAQWRCCPLLRWPATGICPMDCRCSNQQALQYPRMLHHLNVAGDSEECLRVPRDLLDYEVVHCGKAQLFTGGETFHNVLGGQPLHELVGGKLLQARKIETLCKPQHVLVGLVRADVVVAAQAVGKVQEGCNCLGAGNIFQVQLRMADHRLLGLRRLGRHTRRGWARAAGGGLRRPRLVDVGRALNAVAEGCGAVVGRPAPEVRGAPPQDEGPVPALPAAALAGGQVRRRHLLCVLAVERVFAGMLRKTAALRGGVWR